MPKDALRKSHIGITLNDRSARMEARVSVALDALRAQLTTRYGLETEHEGVRPLTDILADLRARYPELTFDKATAKATFLRPDGGFLYVRDVTGERRCILVTEAKRQGTNSDRALEGKPRQAQGNAVERLRKNMTGVDCMFSFESITPFLCFGEGCDFAEGSSILDRVSTMNNFFPLNVVHVDKIFVGDPVTEVFKPTSLFFREEPWSPEEMLRVMSTVAERSIEYYQSRYGLR